MGCSVPHSLKLGVNRSTNVYFHNSAFFYFIALSRPGNSTDGTASLKQLGKTHLKVESAEDVSDKTPAICQTFMIECFQAEGLAVPQTALVEYSDEHSTNRDVALAMFRIGESLKAENNSEIRKMLAELNQTNSSSYSMFYLYAQMIFGDGTVNWGRIVTLFYFGYKMVERGTPLKATKDCVSKYVTNKLAQWISQQGGWVSNFDCNLVLTKYTVYTSAVICKSFVQC